MLKSPSGKIYIGQTIRPIEKRLKEHESGQSKECRAIYNAIQYHGWENIEKDWYECPDSDLNKHEELMMEVLGTLSPNGYNLREGGGSRGKASEETKQMIREALLGDNNHFYGKTHTEEAKQKQREAKRGENNPNYGKTPSNETKQKQRKAKLGENNPMFRRTGEKSPNYGKTPSNETKQKIGDGNRGKTVSEETRQKLKKTTSGENNPMFGKTHTEEAKQKIKEANLGENNHRSKRVYQYGLDGNFINSFGSCREAGLHLKKDRKSISKCAYGDLKTAYGFKWSYTLNIFM